MGVLFSQLLRLDATAACVAVFVVALGSLWVYVALAKPSQPPEEYEGSLSDVATAGKAGGGGRKEKREGKRGRAKKESDGSPKSPPSSRKKKSSSPETIPPPGNGTETKKGEGKQRKKTSSPQPTSSIVAKKPTVAEKPSPPDDGEGEFQLVVTKSSRGKKEAAPVIKPSSAETGKYSSAPKKRKGEGGKMAAGAKQTSSAEKPNKGSKEEIPVVMPITNPKAETPAVSIATTTKPAVTPVTTAELDTAETTSVSNEEDAPVVTRRGRRRGGGRREGGEVDRKAGEWQTQLSRQQLRALKQKEKGEKCVGEQDTSSLATTSGVVSREKREEREERVILTEGDEGERDTKSLIDPTKATKADTKAGVVLSSKATPTDEGAFSVDEPSEGTVAHGNLTELEKAIREAACASSSSSEDIASLQATTTATVAASNGGSLATHAEVDPTPKAADDVVFPSATVTTDTGPEESLSDEEEAIVVSGAESPDTEDWVVLDPPT